MAVIEEISAIHYAEGLAILQTMMRVRDDHEKVSYDEYGGCTVCACPNNLG
jgi:hypothetical protein